jgi:hypothetical protein
MQLEWPMGLDHSLTGTTYYYDYGTQILSSTVDEAIVDSDIVISEG